MNQPRSDTRAIESEDRAAIVKLFQEMNQAWTRGDARAYAGFLTEDADYVVFDGSRLRGRAENARAHQQLYETFLRDTRVWGELESIAFLGADVALVHAVGGVIWPWQRKPSAAARSRQTTVVVRQDGRWLVRAFQNTRVRPLPPVRPDSLPLRLFRLWARLRTWLSRAGRSGRAAGLAAAVLGGGVAAAATWAASPAGEELVPAALARQEPGTISKDRRQLSVQAGVVEAPIDRVAALVAKSIGQGTDRAGKVELDAARRSFAIEGGWWFRGEYQLHPHPRGTLVVYRVVDIARTWRWMVPLVLLQYRLSGQLEGMYDVSRLVRLVGEQLGRPAYVIDPGQPA